MLKFIKVFFPLNALGILKDAFFFFFLLELYPWHKVIPRLGVKLEL